MAVLNTPKLELTNIHGGEISLKMLAEQAADYGTKWHDSIVDNSSATNFSLDENMQIQYIGGGEKRTADITENAFQQLCTRIGGAPAGYLMKCAENGMSDLAVSNFEAWAKNYTAPMMFREFDGSIRATLSPTYERYDAWRILKELRYVVDENRYTPIQVHMSPERFTARFVDFTPLKITERSKLYAGFSVSSSDVGDSGLKIVFFLYRFACRNGMLFSDTSGVIYRSAHRGMAMKKSKISSFSNVFENVDSMIKLVPDAIAAKQHKLSGEDLKHLFMSAKAQIHLSDAGVEKVKLLIGEAYPQTEWGFMNAVTEAAQEYTLDRRLEMEQFAGNMLFQR